MCSGAVCPGCYLLSTKTNSSFFNLQFWTQTLFETTTAGAAADRNRIVAHRNGHTEVSLLQQRRLTFSDRPATTTSRGFLRRAQRLPSALCRLVSLSAALEGRRGLRRQAVAAALTFQTLFFGPLTFGSGAQLRSSSALPHFSAAVRCNAPPDRDDGASPCLTHTLPRRDGHLLSVFPQLRYLLSPPDLKTIDVTTTTLNLSAVAPEPPGTPNATPLVFAIWESS